MISGEFLLQLDSGDELVLKNQFTIFGMQSVLKAAFWDEHADWWIGLCSAIPADNIPLVGVNEPMQGVDGYERVYMPLNKLYWGVMGNVNGESYVESKVAIFTPDPETEWTPKVNRLFITDGAQVVAVSSAFPDGLQNVAAEIRAPYRLYFR